MTKKELKRIDRINNKKHLKEWSISVRNRDNNSCAICRETKYVQAHHIFPKEIIELRFEIDNGISLCANHHKYSKELSAHRNPVTFILWLQRNRNEQYIRILNRFEELLTKGIFKKIE